MKISKIQAAAVAALTLMANVAVAQAYRVTNQVYGYYYANTTVDIAGYFNSSSNSTDYYGSLYDYTAGSSAASVPAAAQSSFTAAGNALYGLPTVAAQGYAYTDWGQNHALMSISGFDPVQTVSGPHASCVQGAGFCFPGTDYTIKFTTSPAAYGVAQSRWEEIYQTGGSSGALNLRFLVHATLGSQPSTSGNPSGSANFYWAERDFNNNALGSVSASYDASTDTWSKQTWSNAAGGSILSTSGSGTLLINETIDVERSFVTGDAVYVDSFLQNYVSGNGIADAQNTVTLTHLDAPSGTRILASSGASYGGVLTFGGGSGSGTVCTTLTCVGGGGGGGGGGPPPVPEPETYALMLAGLGALAWLERRRRGESLVA